MHELAIRQTARQVDIGGAFAQVFGRSPQRGLRSQRSNVIALILFWTGLTIARLNSVYSRGRKDSRSNSLRDIFAKAAASAP